MNKRKVLEQKAPLSRHEGMILAASERTGENERSTHTDGLLLSPERERSASSVVDAETC